MITCCARMTNPTHEPAGTTGIGGNTGTRAMVMTSPAMIRMRTGWAALLKIGAVASRPRMRASGNMKAVIQASSWALVNEIMGDGLQPMMPGMIAVEPLHVVRQHRDHPRAGDDQGDEDDNQLRHEGQRHLVDLRGGLEDADIRGR